LNKLTLCTIQQLIIGGYPNKIIDWSEYFRDVSDSQCRKLFPDCHSSIGFIIRVQLTTYHLLAFDLNDRSLIAIDASNMIFHKRLIG
jgi:hypothetical protein